MDSVFRRIPPEVELPYGYRIAVAMEPAESPNLEGRHATWDVDSRTIYITRTLPIAEKRWCFEHELDHGWNDWKGWVAQNCKIRAPEEGTDEEETGEAEAAENS